MFEEIIAQLDSMGIPYNEDYDTGSLVIDISTADKMQVIDVINVVNATGMEFTVDENSIVVTGSPTEEPMAEGTEEDFQGAALDEMMGGGF
jgi:flagellar biosynthesis/type III secretory pathway M-ring protein FliF/YscJ